MATSQVSTKFGSILIEVGVGIAIGIARDDMSVSHERR
jgi:hypothetical protein